MRNNQQYKQITIVSNEQIHLRGGGHPFSCSKNKIKEINKIDDHNVILNIPEYKKEEPLHKLYSQIKDCLDKIMNIYLQQIENNTNLCVVINYDSFNKQIQEINDILKVQNKQTGNCCIYYYLELVNIALENLQINVSKIKSISIIALFIQISKQKKKSESISNLIDAANSLLIGVQCRYFTQFQKFETYLFFILLNKMIKYQVDQGLRIEVKVIFNKIKDQYIKNSTNWTLYNCWIEFLVDLLSFCKNYTKQKQTQGVVDIINFITNQDGKNLFEIYLQNFKYQELQQNKWISIDNPELHRLNRIVNLLTVKIKFIETQFQTFLKSNDIQQIKQVFQEVYYDLLASQIYLIQMLQLFHMIQVKFQLNMDKKLDTFKNLLNNIKDQIKNILDTERIIKFYFKIQMITNNNYNIDRFKNNTSTLKLQNQIQQLSKLVQVLQKFIITERMVFTNQIILLNDSLLHINQGFESDFFDSFQRKSPVIDTYQDLFYQINFYLFLFYHIKKIQKIFYLNQQQDTLKNKIKDLKDLKLELPEMKELNSLKQQFQNITQNIEQYIDQEQQIPQIQHEQELPYIYQSFYQQIELIIDQQNKDEYKIEESIIFHFQTFNNNPENQELISSCLQQISLFFREKIKQINKQNQLNNNQKQSIDSQMKSLDSSIKSYSTNQSIKQIQNSSQIISEIWQQIHSIYQSIQSQIRNESIKEQNVDLQQKEISSILKKCKINVALRVKYQNQNSNNHIDQLNQVNQGVPEQKLDDVIKQFIYKEKHNFVLIISGQIGCGKTNSLKKLNKQLQEIQRDNPNSQNWIPIYLNLSDIDEPQNQLLMKAIQKNKTQLNINNIEEFHLEILKSKYKVVLLLDGYDQLKEQNNIILQNRLDKRIKNSFQEVTLKIIVTTRNDIEPSEHFQKTKNIQFTQIQLFDSAQQQEYIKQSYKRLMTISLSKLQTIEASQFQEIVEYINQLFYNIPLFYVMPEQVEDDIIYKLIGKITNGIEFQRTMQNEMKKMRYFLENLLIPFLKDILLTPQLLKMAIKKWQQKIWLDFEKEDNKIIKQEFQKEITKLINEIQQGIQVDEVLIQLYRYQFFKEYHLYDIPYLENDNTINLNGKHFKPCNNADLIIQAINALRYSRYTALEQFIGFCQQYKMENINIDLKIFSQKLSTFFKINNQNVVNQQYQNNSQIINNNLENILNPDERKAIGESKLITYNNNKIQFLNQWILDFFFAQKIILLLNSNNEYETMQFLNDEKVNLSNKNYEGVVKLLIEGLMKIKTIKAILIQIVKKSKNQIENIRASSNGIFLLSKMGICVDGEDFKEIMIENTSMIGLHAINCQFNNSRMNNVQIDFCNFNQSKLGNAQFNNVKCSEFPQKEVDEEILQVIIYRQDQWLALLKKNGIVNIVNIVTQEEKQVDIRNPFMKYKQIVISKDDTKLFALTNYQIDLWNLNQYYLATYINLRGESIYFCLSPDNTQIICSLQNQNKEIRIIGLVDYIFKQPKTLQLNQDAEQMSINHSNQLLVFRNKQNQIYIFNAQTSQQINIQQQIQANLFTTTKDGRSLIIQNGNKIIFYQFEITHGDLVQQKQFFISNIKNPIGLFIYENPQIILIQDQNMIQIFDTNNNEVQYLPKKFKGKNSILSGDGKILIIWKYNKVQLWDLISLKNIEQREEIDDIKSCQYSPDGNHLLISSSEKSIFLNVQTNKFQCIHETISSLCFNPQNNMLVTFSKQGLKFWSTKIKDQIQLLYHFDEFQYFEKQKLIFSENGEWLVCINKSIVRCVNMNNIFGTNQNQECQKTIKIKKSNNKRIIVKSPNENLYAIQYESFIQIYEYQLSKIITLISLGESKIFSLSFSEDGKFLVARSSDQKIRIWSIVNFCLICEFNDKFNHQIENHCLWLSDKQTQYIVTNYENHIILYNVSKYLEIGSNSSNTSLQNSEQIQTSFEQPQQSYLEQQYIPYGLMCRNIVISKDHQYIAISYAKQQEDKNQKVPIIIKKTNTQEQLPHKIENQGGFLLAFCPNSQYLATDSYKDNQSYIIIWNIKSQQAYKSFIINTRQSYIINSIEFSPKETQILISDKFGHFSLHNHQIPALNQSDQNHQQDQHCDLQNALIQNTYCIISINGEYLVYIQNNKLKFEKIQTRLNNIKLIPNYQYKEKDQFNFISNLISYSYGLNKIIKFDLGKCSFGPQMSYDLSIQTSTFSQKGKYFAFFNKSNQQFNIYVSNVLNQTTFLNKVVQNPIDVMQFSNNDNYLVTLYHTDIIIYQFDNQENQQNLNQFQVIKMNSRLLSIQFHPKNNHQFIVVENGEILLYNQQGDQQKKFKKCKTISFQYELQCQEANINDFQITSNIQQQTLRALFTQKGACNSIINL